VLGDVRTLDPATFDAKAAAARRSQTYRMLADTLGFCTWVLPLDCGYYEDDLGGDPAALGDLFTAVTGIETDEDALLLLGERVLALERLQGGRHGYHSRPHDLSATDPRLSTMAKDGSPLPGGVIDRDRLAAEVERYYDLMGWDRRTGMPTEETLRRLGISDLATADRSPHR
jgi:aldehyde:ferredoxin oxidoreductase